MKINNRREQYPKSKFRLCVTRLHKFESDNEDGDQPKFAVIDSTWTNENGKEFMDSAIESKHDIEIVNKKPERFIINRPYMLATRDVVWIWTTD